MKPPSRIIAFLVLLCSFIVTGHYPVGYSYLPPPSTYSHPQQQPLFSHAAPTYWAVYACPICPAGPPQQEPDTELETVLEFTKKVGDTVCQVGTTLTEIGAIALEDNPEVGAEIIKKLQDQVSAGSKVMSQYTGKTGSGNKRGKRAAMMDGKDALDKVGASMAKVAGMIEGDMKKLSKRAQDKINKKNKDGLDKCRADSCKAASKLLADADDGERQR